MAKEERRRNVRVTFRATTLLKFQDRIFKECETTNVSVGGAFVKDIKGPKKGDTCEVVFHLVGRTSNLILEMSGEVVRVSKSGVALQFFDIDDDSFCHLKNIVYFNYKNPAELGDEYDFDDEIDDEEIYRGLELEDSPVDEPFEENDYDDDDVLDHIRPVRNNIFSDQD